MHTPGDDAARPSRLGSIDAVDTPLLVAVPDAARLLGIGATLAWDLVRAGDIPSVKLGRRVLVPRAALEHLALAHVSAQAQEPDREPDAPYPLHPTYRQGTARRRPSPS